MTSVENPLVSIITPVKNGERFLPECIDSVLSQNYQNTEHIFIDGVSTDGTLKLLQSYQAKYPGRIRFISEPDSGAGDAWNKGLTLAKGEIFGWLGADDTYEPDAIMTVVEFFQTHPDACFVFGAARYIDEHGRVSGKAFRHDFNLKEAISDACYIPCTSAFYRRDVVEKIGLLDTREVGVELDYWIRVGKQFTIYRIDKVLSNFRIHEGSISNSKQTQRLYIKEGFRVSRRHGGSILSMRALRYFISRARILDWVFPLATPFYRWIKGTNKQ